VVKITFENKPKSRRKVGRPRLRWLEDVQDDLRELTAKSWRQKVNDG
jgi:hypothetical protein